MSAVPAVAVTAAQQRLNDVLAQRLLVAARIEQLEQEVERERSTLAALDAEHEQLTTYLQVRTEIPEETP